MVILRKYHTLLFLFFLGVFLQPLLETECWIRWVLCLTSCQHCSIPLHRLHRCCSCSLPPAPTILQHLLLPNSLSQEFSNFSTIRITFNIDISPFKILFIPAKRRYLNSAHPWLQWFKLILGRPREIYARAFSSLINTR